MTPAKFNAFCQSLPATTTVMQWGGSQGLSKKRRIELGL